MSDAEQFCTLLTTGAYAFAAFMVITCGVIEQRARLFYAGSVLLGLTPVATVGFAHYIHAAAGAMP